MAVLTIERGANVDRKNERRGLRSMEYWIGSVSISFYIAPSTVSLQSPSSWQGLVSCLGRAEVGEAGEAGEVGEVGEVGQAGQAGKADEVNECADNICEWSISRCYGTSLQGLTIFAQQCFWY